MSTPTRTSTGSPGVLLGAVALMLIVLAGFATHAGSGEQPATKAKRPDGRRIVMVEIWWNVREVDFSEENDLEVKWWINGRPGRAVSSPPRPMRQVGAQRFWQEATNLEPGMHVAVEAWMRDERVKCTLKAVIAVAGGSKGVDEVATDTGPMHARAEWTAPTG